VKINIEQSDTTLRPGMTTSNAIETASIERVLSIPLEAVTTEGGLSFVYKRDGSHVVKQQIETGVMNDNEIVVRRGLQKGDKVLLVPPPDKANLKVELIPGLKPVPPATSGGDTAKRVTLPGPAKGKGR
jgi:multidrug efflux pump subunit AcrA (membrane-fusion protein)